MERLVMNFRRPKAWWDRLRSLEDLTAQGNGRPQLSRKRKGLIILILVFVSLVQAFDATCICVTLPTIADELNASVSESLSLGTSFLLAMTVSQPLFIEFSSVWGRKVAYVSTVLVFIVGTLICGCANSSTLLLVGRCVQGVGAGGPQPLAAMILADIYPIRKRSKLVAFLNIPWAVGTALGPILGGIFTDSDIGWRWIFWINLPFLGFAFIGSWIFLKYDTPNGRFLDRLNDVDWTGTLIFILSAIAFLWALVWGGSRYPWQSPYVLGPLILAAAGFLMLGFYERVGTKHPMFRRSVFSGRSPVLQYVNTTIHGILLWMVLYYMSLFYLGVKGFSPTETGLWALPATASVAPMATLVGFCASKSGSYRWFLWSGWINTTVVFGVMILINANMAMWKLTLIISGLGIAMGSLIPSMSIGIQATIRDRANDSGHALSMIYVLRAAGQCLGVAIGQGIFSARLEKELRAIGQDEVAAKEMLKTIGHSLKTGGLHDVRLLGAADRAFGFIWIFACALAGFAGLLTVFIKCPRLPEDRDDVPGPILLDLLEVSPNATDPRPYGEPVR